MALIPIIQKARATSMNSQLAYALKEIQRLGAVIHSTRLEEKYESEEEIAKAMLGDDLSFEKIPNFQISGWLLKRSETLKIWNRRFFVLVDKFLIYYLKRKEVILFPFSICYYFYNWTCSYVC